MLASHPAAALWALLGQAYLLGSIPTAYIVTHLALGKDIRDLGDGNMGAKNTFYSVGWPAAAVVATADVGKGALSVVIAQRFGYSGTAVMLAGVCAVLGHDFPVFARFRGGQGMAATAGVMLALFPIESLQAVGAFGVVLLLSRNWDLGCAAGFVLLVGLLWLGGRPTAQCLYPVVLIPIIGLRRLWQVWRSRRAAA